MPTPDPNNTWYDLLSKDLPVEFPIQNWDDEPNCPSGIPMRLALAHNRTFSRNHDMGAHHLYSHGISPVDLFYVLRDEQPSIPLVWPQDAITYIRNAVYLYEYPT